MDTYTVEFRIQGSTLNPLEITRLLDLEPSLTRNMETIARSNRKREPIWSYDGISTEKKFVEQKWETLEEGLQFLLDILLPKQEQILATCSEYNVFFWCGFFQESFDGGPTLSPDLLRKLADFGVKLIIKNYKQKGENGDALTI